MSVAVRTTVQPLFSMPAGGRLQMCSYKNQLSTVTPRTQFSPYGRVT